MAATSTLFTLGVILGKFQGETISIREHEATELLDDLVNHVDCARSEDNADEVLCKGCYASLDAAKEWLNKTTPLGVNIAQWTLKNDQTSK